MSKQLMTNKIMKKVARNAEKNIIISFILLTLLFSVSATVFSVALKTTIVRLIERDFFKLITGYEYNFHTILPRLHLIGLGIIKEVVEGVLLISILSFIVIVFTLKKYHSSHFTRRIREVLKYIK